MSEIRKPVTEEEVDKAKALEDLEHIAALKQSKAFNAYFLREPLAKIKEIEKKLRDRSLTENDRQYVLGELAVWERIRDKLADDFIGNRSIAGLD